MNVAYIEEDGGLVVVVDDEPTEKGCPFMGPMAVAEIGEEVDVEEEGEVTLKDGEMKVGQHPCGLWCPHCDVVPLGETINYAGKAITAPCPDAWTDNDPVVQLTCGGGERIYLFGPSLAGKLVD